MAASKRFSLSDFSEFPYFDKISLYAHDSMVKRNKLEAAAEFARRHNLDLTQKLEIDVPEGFLHLWIKRVLLRQRIQAKSMTNAEASSSNVNSPMTSQHVNLQDNTDGSNHSMPQQQDSNTAGNLKVNNAIGMEVVKSEITAFNAKQVGSSRLIRQKITCCHSSSCGKFLASAGSEITVMGFEADSKVTRMEKEHSDIITDVRFKPNSTQIATSSFDGTIILWDATESCKSVFKLEGHGGKVMSVDFSEKDTSLLCSCDTNNEIRFWNLSYESPRCVCTFQGGNKQVRFRPLVGNLLAAASGSTLNLIDVHTYQVLDKLEDHTKDIKSICWDTSGNYIAAVSEDSARVWCVSGGKFTQELTSDGHIFESCLFYPHYWGLLIIAAQKGLMLWNTKTNGTSFVSLPNKGNVSSLAHAPDGNMVSRGHDGSLKRWNFKNKHLLRIQ